MARLDIAKFAHANRQRPLRNESAETWLLISVDELQAKKVNKNKYWKSSTSIRFARRAKSFVRLEEISSRSTTRARVRALAFAAQQS